MKVLSFYCGYLPGQKYGGPVSSLYNMVELIGEDIDVYIVCSNHDLNETNMYPNIVPGWNKVGKANVKYISDAEMNSKVYWEILIDVNPNIIYISSIFSARFNAPVYRVAKKEKIPILIAPRGELNSRALLGGKLKKAIYLKFFRIFNHSNMLCFQATSDDEYQDIQKVLKLPSSNILLLPNVPSIPCKKNNIEKHAKQLKMCYVGRIVPNKNLEVCLEALKKVESNVTFDVFGPKEDISYYNKCKNLIDQLPNNVNVNMCGTLNQIEMRNRYKDYDCLISPTQFENYGQAIVESMLHDTPVIISKGTTPWDDICNGNAGFVIGLENIDGFTEAIDNIGYMNLEKYSCMVSRLRDYVQNTFNLDELKQNYIDAFKNIIY